MTLELSQARREEVCLAYLLFHEDRYLPAVRKIKKPFFQTLLARTIQEGFLGFVQKLNHFPTPEQLLLYLGDHPPELFWEQKKDCEDFCRKAESLKSVFSRGEEAWFQGALKHALYRNLWASWSGEASVDSVREEMREVETILSLLEAPEEPEDLASAATEIGLEDPIPYTLPLGFPELDRCMLGGGLPACGYTLFTSLKGAGKSAFCISLAARAWRDGDFNVFYVSTEMPRLAVLRRMASSLLEVPAHEVSGRLAEAKSLSGLFSPAPPGSLFVLGSTPTWSRIENLLGTAWGDLPPKSKKLLILDLADDILFPRLYENEVATQDQMYRTFHAAAVSREAVLICVGHVSKKHAERERVFAAGARGSYIKHIKASVALNLKPKDVVDPTTTLLDLELETVRYGVPGYLGIYYRGDLCTFTSVLSSARDGRDVLDVPREEKGVIPRQGEEIEDVL